MVTETRGLVLLDALAGEDREFVRNLLERWEHPVQVCEGPEVRHLCPLLGGEGCERFGQAHGIVFKLDLDRPQHRAILRRYRELGRADLPIRVVCTPEQAARYGDVLREVEVWDHEPSIADLDGFVAEVEAVERFT
jgi:hypothetical protein